MASTYDYIVIGAGICGSSAAYYLQKNGAGKVLLLERGPAPASSNTGKSAAIVRTFYTIPLMARLAASAVELFATFEDEFGNDGGFRQTGFTQLIPHDWMDIASEKVAMHQSLGIDTRLIDPEVFAREHTWLNPEGIGSVIFEKNSGYADPVRTTEAIVNTFIKLGGEARFRTPCRGLIRDGERITGVLLEDGSLNAATVINAAGPWSRFLAEQVGIELPIRAVREQDTVWEVVAGRPMPGTPVANAVEAVYLRPLGGERWLIGRGYPKPYAEVDPNNFKLSHDNDAALDMHQRWVSRIPPLQGARLLEGYAALYDVTPDWLPFVGPRQGLEGYCDFAGGSGHLFKTGPIVARELVQWILQGTVAEDFRQFSYDRVSAGNLFQQGFGGNRV